MFFLHIHIVCGLLFSTVAYQGAKFMFVVLCMYSFVCSCVNSWTSSVYSFLGFYNITLCVFVCLIIRATEREKEMFQWFAISMAMHWLIDIHVYYSWHKTTFYNRKTIKLFWFAHFIFQFIFCGSPSPLITCSIANIMCAAQFQLCFFLSESEWLFSFFYLWMACNVHVNIMLPSSLTNFKDKVLSFQFIWIKKKIYFRLMNNFPLFVFWNGHFEKILLRNLKEK